MKLCDSKFSDLSYLIPSEDNLTTFGETAEVACHATLFKTDGLTTIRTGFAKETVCKFVSAFVLLILEISLFKNTADGIRYG